MATVQYAIGFEAPDFDPATTNAERLVIEEGISEISRAEIGLWFTIRDADVPDVSALLRKPGTITVQRVDTGETVRRFTGLITAVRERLSRRDELYHFTVVIESPLHALSRSTDYRVFLEKTTKEIVETVLTEGGISSGSVSWKLSGSYKPREVCTQWGETALDFVRRIMEEDGIFFFHTYGEETKLVVGDDAAVFPEMEGLSEIKCQAPSDLNPSEEAVTRLLNHGALRPGKVTLLDHDFKKPSLDLTAEATKETPFEREFYLYPGRYVEQGEGKRKANVILDGFVSSTSLVTGEGSVFRMAPGLTFSIAEGPAWTDGVTWVVRRVKLDWTLTRAGTEFSTNFALFPKDQSFRPPRLTPRPVVLGPQTASVTGPAGEEIHCDEHGRIRIQYTWDRHGKQDDKSSCWVRVGQMHTSGSVVIPRIGWEVLVEFEDGDPDKPIAVGRVYNAATPPPMPLPGSKTSSMLKSLSTPGGGGHNEISMNDGGGGEVVSVHAQKDLNLVVANNKEEKVTTNATISIGANQSQKVGANQTVKVGAADAIKITGAQKHTVGAARTKTVTAGEKLDVKGDRSNTIGASHTIMTPKTVECSTKGSFSETVGASCMEVAAMEVSTAVAGSASITVGAAKIEAVAAGKSDTTAGARASTIGGALLSLSGADSGVSTSGAKATTVGGAWLAAAGKDAELSSAADLKINVGGAVIMNAAKIVLKVGGSTVTMSGGKVVLDSKEIKLTASGPNAEAAPIVASK